MNLTTPTLKSGEQSIAKSAANLAQLGSNIFNGKPQSGMASIGKQQNAGFLVFPDEKFKEKASDINDQPFTPKKDSNRNNYHNISGKDSKGEIATKPFKSTVANVFASHQGPLLGSPKVKAGNSNVSIGSTSNFTGSSGSSNNYKQIATSSVHLGGVKNSLKLPDSIGKSLAAKTGGDQNANVKLTGRAVEIMTIKKLFNGKQFALAVEQIDRFLAEPLQLKEELSQDEHTKRIIALLQLKSDCLLHLNRHEDFFKCQDDIFRLDPSQTKVFISKGSIFFQIHKYNDSLNQFEKYVSIISNDDNAFYLKGLVEEKLKLYEKALDSFEHSLAINPTSEKVLKKRTPLLAQLGRIQEAAKNQEKVIELYEGSNNKQNCKLLYQQYFLMGKLCFILNRIDEAFMYLEKAIGEKGDHSETYFYLGECFRVKGQIENASECYEKAALYDSNNNLAIQRKDEMMHILEQSQPVVQKQKQQQNLHSIQEEYCLTFDDIKRDIEKTELDRKKLNSKPKELGGGEFQDNNAFELESTRSLVQQYQMNLAPFKSFMRIQDFIERSSINSGYLRQSMQSFRNGASNVHQQAKDDDCDKSSSQIKLKNKFLFASGPILFTSPQKSQIGKQ